jgi:hypothetical protein
MRKGSHHTDAAKAAIGRANSVSRPRRPINEDVKALRLVGRVTVWKFAERTGCTERSARIRLDRLVEHRLASRFTGPRGFRGYLYAVSVSGDVKIKTSD